MAVARVLIVDDEPNVLAFVSKVLSLRGYETRVASSPRQALELVETGPHFDLVVSDVIMPGMCGPELVKHITRKCPKCAVVLMSAYVACEELPELARFISKPFLVKDLYSVVEQALALATP